MWMCGASFRVNYDDMLKKYVVTDFQEEHNHTLAMKEDVHLMCSYRHIKEVNKEQVREMKRVGMKTSQIMDYMVT